VKNPALEFPAKFTMFAPAIESIDQSIYLIFM